MKIALVVYGDLDQRSGGNLYDRFLVSELESRGHQVEVVGIERPSSWYLAEVWRGWRRRALAQRQRLALLRCDLIVEDELIHPSLFAEDLGGMGAAETSNSDSGVPRVCLVHHLRSSEDRGALENFLAARIERRYLRRFEHFLFNSETTRRSVAELVGSENEGCSWAIAYPAGDWLPLAQVLRQRAQGPATLESCLLDRSRDRGAPLRILFIGNLIVRKGLHRVLDALASVTSFDWTLDIVGGEHYERGYAQSQRQRTESESGLEGRVRWHGSLEDGELAALLLDSHCLCVPSSWEGYGIVYAEAQTAGVPVIAGNSGATWEIVEAGVTGFLVDPSSPTAIREALRSLAEDRALLEQMSYNCLGRARERHGWQESMAEAASYLESVSRVA